MYAIIYYLHIPFHRYLWWPYLYSFTNILLSPILSLSMMIENGLCTELSTIYIYSFPRISMVTIFICICTYLLSIYTYMFTCTCPCACISVYVLVRAYLYVFVCSAYMQQAMYALYALHVCTAVWASWRSYTYIAGPPELGDPENFRWNHAYLVQNCAKNAIQKRKFLEKCMTVFFF